MNEWVLIIYMYCGIYGGGDIETVAGFSTKERCDVVAARVENMPARGECHIRTTCTNRDPWR